MAVLKGGAGSTVIVFCGGGNLGEDTSISVPSSVPSSVPVPLVTQTAGSLVSTLTPANTLVTPESQGGE